MRPAAILGRGNDEGTRGAKLPRKALPQSSPPTAPPLAPWRSGAVPINLAVAIHLLGASWRASGPTKPIARSPYLRWITASLRPAKSVD